MFNAIDQKFHENQSSPTGAYAFEAAEPPLKLDTGLTCLVMMARLLGVGVDPDQLAHEFSENGRMLGVAELLLAAKHLHLKAKLIKTGLNRLEKTPLPAIAIGGAGDFFILARCEGNRVLIQSPDEGRPKMLNLVEFQSCWSGELILLTSRASLSGDLSKFDFTWFIPAVVKYRKLLGEVLLVSLVLQCFALITPLFFQVIMDKVLVHRGFATLDVIAIGLAVVILFEVSLTALRSYVFSHTTSRMDVELGASLFRHLLNLPIAYFQARRVGDSVARIRELENIRSFLTGNSVTLVLDLLFSVVFIAVMLFYSGWLTLIVIASLPCYIILSVVFTPLLRARLHEKFNRNAENQAFLVETISGIDTVKSMAVEPQWLRQWDNQLAAYVSSSFRAATVGTLANSGVTLISKLVTVAMMYLGARLVIEGQLTVGQLIAFNMLAGQVAQPVIRLASLWTDFQQIGISMQRLGDILNTRTEVAGNKSALPPLNGRLTLDDVVFRYSPGGPEVLKNIRLDIAPGKSLEWSVIPDQVRARWRN